jgi:outer membrane protein OmpA-like peptidoglycan-associated protein
MKITAKLLLYLLGTAICLPLIAKTINVPSEYRSILRAIQSAEPGDTVFVKKGIYNENIVLKDGIFLIGEDMLRTVINGRRKGPVVIGADECLIKNFTITNGTAGIVCKNAAPVIENNLILDNKGTGIHCLIALAQIKNNIIMRNKWTGIFCESAKSINTAIENNVILENYYCGILCANNTQVVIRNNIIFDNDEYGIYCYKFAKRSRIVYNNIWSNYFAFNQYCLVDKTNISRNPMFLNEGFPVFNYYVKSISPCKNAGENGVDIGLLTEEATQAASQDQDNDGIPDEIDRCPTVPEDRDGTDDQDGCPDYDNDQDGIYDVNDKCPNEAEDRDGFEDQDGCPDPDNDQDGISDANDRCPNFPETMNGFKDDDGCPDEKPTMIKEKMVLKGVNFKTASADLTEESYIILEQVYNSLEAFPAVRIEISGHTDDIGSARANKLLSQERANSVRMYLVRRGISPSRIIAIGYGEENPQQSNRTADGRAANRRVEITPIK